MKSLVACSQPRFSPHYHISEVDVVHLQSKLCEMFVHWGLPRAIKVDNGRPFGDPQRSSVPVLALWLIGLGIEVKWNRPRSPTDNAKVERMQGTTSRWVELSSCTDRVALQSRLDKAAHIQREAYRVKRLGFRTRQGCYEALWHNDRKYQGNASFEISAVRRHLSAVVFDRKVNAKSVLNFYAQRVYLGREHRSKTVRLSYELDKDRFVIKEQAGEVIGYLGADNFSQENILALRVCQNRYAKCSNFMSFYIAQT